MLLEGGCGPQLANEWGRFGAGEQNGAVLPSCEVLTVGRPGSGTPGADEPSTNRPVARAARLLRRGGLVAFPTETVYGLGANAFDDDAVGRIFEAKQRPASDPLIVHLAGVEDVDEVVAEWSAAAVLLAGAFWPGPLSLVVPRHERVPSRVTAGGPAVAVRVPAHPVARDLIRAAGVPVAAPSANRFGRISPTTADHVVEELGDRIELVLDAGPTPLGVESTVVDLTGTVPVLRRPGGVTLEDLRSVVPAIEVAHRSVLAPGQAATAPGELLAHYSPATPVVLVEAGDEVLEQLVAAAVSVGIAARRLPLSSDASAAARELYAAMRAADRPGIDLLLAPTVDPEGLGRAVNDRLYRAAHGRVVTDAAPGTVARLGAIAACAPPRES